MGFPRSTSQNTPPASRYPPASMAPRPYGPSMTLFHPSLMPRYRGHPSPGHPSLSSPHAFTSMSRPQLQHATPGNAAMPFHPRANRGAAHRPPWQFNQRQFGAQQVAQQQTHPGDPFLSLRQPPPSRLHDPRSQEQMHSMQPGNYQPRYDLYGRQNQLPKQTLDQQQRQQEMHHPPAGHEHYLHSLPSHGPTIDQQRHIQMQQQRQGGQPPELFYPEGSQSQLGNQTVRHMSSQQQQQLQSLSQTPQHGIPSSSQYGPRQPFDKQFTSMTGQQLPQGAVSRQEERQPMIPKQFTKQKTVPFDPVSCVDDKRYQALEQYRLQMSDPGKVIIIHTCLCNKLRLYKLVTVSNKQGNDKVVALYVVTRLYNTLTTL